MSSISSALMVDALNHLNGRQRGREARLARLAAAGVPTERAALQKWYSDAIDAQLVAEGGLFHACTVRISSGVDADLPKAHGIGCRISRVPLTAEHIRIGDVCGTIKFSDGHEQVIIADESFFVISYGNCGPGFMEPSYDRHSSSANEALAKARVRLLRKDDCFSTRAEAVDAVLEMLSARVGRLAP